MANLDGFNASHYESEKVDLIPEGKYFAEIRESEWVNTKSGTGKYLKLKYQLVNGSCKGRFVWEMLHLDNPNTQAVEIANRKLADICRAVGVLTPRDSVELHDKMLEIKVVVRDGKDGYEPSNDVRGHKPAKQLVKQAVTTSQEKPDDDNPF